MKAARDFVSDFNEVTAPPETHEQRVERVADMKPEINNLVHTALPEKTTIAEADVIANLIIDILLHPSKYLYP
jgi:hypothetical protein